MPSSQDLTSVTTQQELADVIDSVVSQPDGLLDQLWHAIEALDDLGECSGIDPRVDFQAHDASTLFSLAAAALRRTADVVGPDAMPLDVSHLARATVARLANNQLREPEWTLAVTELYPDRCDG